MKLRNALALTGSTFLSVGLATAAAAQTSIDAPATNPPAPQTDAPAAGDEGGLTEIIVTARRTSENLQRVPVSATVLTSDALDRQQIRRATDLQYNSPSLVITPDPLGGSSAPVFQLRGQTSPLGADNTVVNYFADVPTDSRTIAAGIYDLASVQVIRGPQGTLFGKNSTGGAVVFTPRKADTDTFNGYIDATLGDYNLRQFTGALNVPIAPGVFGIRVSGQIARQDGFVKNLSGNDGNDKHYDAVRLSATFTPGGGFRNDFLVTYFNGKQHLNPPITTAVAGFTPFDRPSLQRQQQIGNRTIDQSTTPNNDDNESYLISNSTSYEFGDGITIKNIIGYWRTHSNIRLNATSFPFALVDVAQDRILKQFSNELQLSGKSFNEHLTWIVGGFYSKQDMHVDQVSRIFNPSPTTASTSTDAYKSRAIYGQASLDLAAIGVNGLKLTGGLRNTWDSRSGTTVNYANPGSFSGPRAPLGLNNKDTQLSWTVGLDYQVTNQVLLYAVSRHSYKAGGFNLISPDVPLILRSYAPEKLTDVEIGAKAQFQAGSVPVRANLALYRGEYRNIHTQITAACNGGGLNSLIVNAGKGTPKGLEFEAEARFFKALTVSGFYNRTLGKYNQFVIPAVNGCSTSAASLNLTGQNFGSISKDTAGLTAVLKLPVPPSVGDLSVTGNLYYRSSRLGNDLRGFQSPLPGYTIYNFRADFENIGGSGARLGVYLKNATNKLYGVTRNNTLSLAGYDTTVFGDPRTYGVEVGFKF